MNHVVSSASRARQMTRHPAPQQSSQRPCQFVKLVQDLESEPETDRFYRPQIRHNSLGVYDLDILSIFFAVFAL
jgi:hypothetical protein